MTTKMTFGRYDCAAFLCMIAYAMGSMLVPIALVEIAGDLRFPLSEGGKGLGGALQLARSMPMVATLVLCGFAAGRWGKCRSLGFSMLCVGLGVLLIAAAPAYGLLFAAMIVAGLGEGIIEGLLTPFVQDLHEEEPGRYINFTHSFWSVGVILATVGAGALLYAGVSWRIIAALIGILAAIPALLLLKKPQNAPAYPERNRMTPGGVVWQRTVRIMRLPRFWLYFAGMFMGGGAEFCLTFWIASLIKEDYQGNALIAGIATAVFALGMMTGRMYFGYKIRQEHLPHLLIATAAAGIGIGAVFPSIDSIVWILALLFPLGVASAPFWPSMQSHCTKRLEEFRVDDTMVFVLLSCAGVPGCGFFAFFMGYVSDHTGLRNSFYLVPLCYVVMGGIIVWDFIAARREKHQ